MNTKRRSDDGFTLVEALVATTIIVSVTAAALSVLNPSRGVFKTQPEVADLQQRLRIGVDTLTRELLNAGAGAYSGASAGSLIGYFAPIMPFRRGRDVTIDDGAGVFKSDAITILYVGPTATQTTLKTDMANAASPLAVDVEAGCPGDSRTGLVNPLCGFKPNVTRAAVFDGTGALDTFVVSSADELTKTIDFPHAELSALSKAYLESPSNHVTKVVEISTHVYYLNRPTRQLMHYDGFSTVMPVLDNVVDLGFEYYGEPAPPAFVRPGKDQSVTYGPAPPAPEVTQTPFDPGENCTWQVIGGAQVTRLAALGSFGEGLMRLTAAELADGAWGPGRANPNRYDADLLRVRRVRVALRVQSGNDSVRGSLATGNDAMFINRGTAASRSQTVPDRTIRFDVSPRNLNVG